MMTDGVQPHEMGEALGLLGTMLEVVERFHDIQL
jgi:hypothetical protein